MKKSTLVLVFLTFLFLVISIISVSVFDRAYLMDFKRDIKEDIHINLNMDKKIYKIIGQEENYNVEGIENIEIEIADLAVSVSQADQDEINIKGRGKYKIEKKRTTDGKTLKIKLSTRKSGKVEIQMPEKFLADLDFDLNDSSLKFEGKAKNLNISSSDSNIEISGRAEIGADLKINMTDSNLSSYVYKNNKAIIEATDSNINIRNLDESDAKIKISLLDSNINSNFNKAGFFEDKDLTYTFGKGDKDLDIDIRDSNLNLK